MWCVWWWVTLWQAWLWWPGHVELCDRPGRAGTGSPPGKAATVARNLKHEWRPEHVPASPTKNPMNQRPGGEGQKDKEPISTDGLPTFGCRRYGRKRAAANASDRRSGAAPPPAPSGTGRLRAPPPLDQDPRGKDNTLMIDGIPGLDRTRRAQFLFRISFSLFVKICSLFGARRLPDIEKTSPCSSDKQESLSKS